MALKKILALVAGVALFVSSAVAEDVTLHQESFDNLTNLTATSVPAISPSLLGASWGLSNAPRVRLPRFGNPKVLSGASGTFFVGRLLARTGSLKVKTIDISEHEDLKVNVSLAAGADLPAFGALTKLRDSFSRFEYLSVMVNNKPLRVFIGGNPQRSSQYRPSMSALVNVATGETIPTTFGNFSFSIPAAMVGDATELNIEFKARTISGYVGIDSLQVVGVAKEPPVREETVVKDHVSSKALWEGEWSVDHYCSLGGTCQVSPIAASVFVGNGEILKRVGGVFAHMDQWGNPNQGNIDMMSFYLMFYNSVQDFYADPYLNSLGSPNRRVEYPTPTNPDYKVIVGHSMPIDGVKDEYYYWELDVESLGIETTPGQKHVAVMWPRVRAASGSTFLAFSNAGAPHIGEELDLYALLSGDPRTEMLPNTLQAHGAPHNYVAVKITTIPAAE